MEQTRTTSTSELLKKFRAGLTDAEFMDEYGLSQEELQRLFKRLVASGFLNQTEIDVRQKLTNIQKDKTITSESLNGQTTLTNTELNTASDTTVASKAGWKCPACGRIQSESFEECPICGIIVKKYLEIQERERNMMSTITF